MSVFIISLAFRVISVSLDEEFHFLTEDFDAGLC